MKRRSRWAMALALLELAFVVTGCATTRHGRSHRGGLLSDGHTGFQGGPANKREIAATPEPSVIQGYGLGWPLRDVKVTSEFGKRDNSFHEGVDLKAPTGTPVYAAQSGTVLYAGSRISGYGRLIVIRHPSGIATVYAHNSKLNVLTKQKVTKGQLIAYSGSTGHSTGPHLHFEVRKGTLAMDPMRFLAYGEAPRASGRAYASNSDPTAPPVVQAHRPVSSSGSAPARAPLHSNRVHAKPKVRVAQRSAKRVKKTKKTNRAKRSRSSAKRREVAQR